MWVYDRRIQIETGITAQPSSKGTPLGTAGIRGQEMIIVEFSRSHPYSEPPGGTPPGKVTGIKPPTNANASEEPSGRDFRRLDDTHLDTLYRFALTLELMEQATNELLLETYRQAAEQFESGPPKNENERKQKLFSILIEVYKRDHRSREIIPVESRSDETRPQAYPLDRVSLSIMNDLDETFFENISTEQLDNSLKHLPDICRICIHLSDVEEFSHDEVAVILDCSADTVRSQLHQGRNILKRKLIRSEVSKGVLPTP